jgi:retron-type reverse transcriptase
MSLGRIDRIIDAVRHERYRFSPARRVYITKRNGTLRPLGLPTWSDKLLDEVVRLLLEAYYEPTFSDRSHGFHPGRGCHTALTEVANTWTLWSSRSRPTHPTGGDRHDQRTRHDRQPWRRVCST